MKLITNINKEFSKSMNETKIKVQFISLLKDNSKYYLRILIEETERKTNRKYENIVSYHSAYDFASNRVYLFLELEHESHINKLNQKIYDEVIDIYHRYINPQVISLESASLMKELRSVIKHDDNILKKFLIKKTGEIYLEFDGFDFSFALENFKLSDSQRHKVFHLLKDNLHKTLRQQNFPIETIENINKKVLANILF